MAIDVTTAKRIRYDGLETYLNLQLDPGMTIITFKTILSADGGAPIADINPGNNEYLPLSILDANYRLAEIVYLTDYKSEALTGTIQRGAEGTLADKTHQKDNKVVHSATVVDYVIVQEHETDLNAHGNLVQQANAYTDGKMADHVNALDPHSQYAKKAGDTFTGDVIFGGTAKTVTVNGNLDIPVGASLTVEGELRITGKLFLNGREIVASNTPPGAPSANTIYFQTFG